MITNQKQLMQTSTRTVPFLWKMFFKKNQIDLKKNGNFQKEGIAVRDSYWCWFVDFFQTLLYRQMPSPIKKKELHWLNGLCLTNLQRILPLLTAKKIL